MSEFQGLANISTCSHQLLGDAFQATLSLLFRAKAFEMRESALERQRQMLLPFHADSPEI